MLTHYPLGPTEQGRYFAAYDTPGCKVPTLACECASLAQATEESKRLNQAQRAKEMALRLERSLCGFPWTAPIQAGTFGLSISTSLITQPSTARSGQSIRPASAGLEVMGRAKIYLYLP